jgi:hypothetical protein
MARGRRGTPKPTGRLELDLFGGSGGGGVGGGGCAQE